MNTEKYALQTKTHQHYILRTALNGFGKMQKSKWPVWMIVLVLAVIISLALTAHSLREWVVSITAALVFCVSVPSMAFALGYIPGAKDIYDNLVRIGMTNAAGEAPVPMQKTHKTGNIETLCFYSKGFPLSAWQEMQEKLETGLDITIVGISEGASKRETIIDYVPGNIVLPRKISWTCDYISDDNCEIRLGESVCGPVSINLAAAPHILVGGTTGSGKTRLLELIAEQFIYKGGYLLLADFKGVDYGRFDGSVRIAHNNDELLSILDYLRQTFTERQERLQHAGCRNIDEYNAQGNNMGRIMLIIDEASAVFDTTGRSKDDKDTIAKILSAVLELTRLGRFAGIHIAIGTQRPDVNSVPGSVKANLAIRICGRMPDVATSTVILDDGAAANLPAIPGRFLLRDGSGHETILQAYIIDDDMKG